MTAVRSEAALHGAVINEAMRLTAADLAQAVKPRLRGWLHAGTFPLALVAGLVLIALGPTVGARLCAAAYG